MTSLCEKMSFIELTLGYPKPFVVYICIAKDVKIRHNIKKV